MTFFNWLKSIFKEKAPTRPRFSDDCLNPDYCGTGDVDTICENCEKK